MAESSGMYDPFVGAALSVLGSHVSIQVRSADIRLHSLADALSEVSLMLFCTGQQVRGAVLYAMSEQTAATIVSRLLGCSPQESAVSLYWGIAQFGKMLGEQAARALAEADVAVRISPPALLAGEDTLRTKLNLQGWLVPLDSAWGEIQIMLALSELNQREKALPDTNVRPPNDSFGI